MPKPKRGPQRSLTPEDLRDALADTSRDIVGHFSVRFGTIDQRFDGLTKEISDVQEQMHEGFRQVDIKLDAIMELLATRKQLHNLVRELRAQGMKLDETAIFAE